MYNIVYRGSVVANASTFTDAKREASIYRRQYRISDWRSVTIKKAIANPVKKYFADDGCCDALRDSRREIYGMGS